MSVASKNLFALLNDDASDAVESPPKPVEKTTSPSSQETRGKRGGGPASRGGRYYQRGGKTSAAGETNNDEASPVEKRQNFGDDSRGGRGKSGRGGRGRGRGGGGGGFRGREFDRQSGTLPDSQKRVHQGWGGDDGERELQQEQAAEKDALAESQNTPAAPTDVFGAPAADPDAWATGEATTAEAAATEAPVNNEGGEKEPRRRRFEEEEEEDNTLTLDQYLAQKKETQSSIVPKIENGRQANEGSDNSLWKAAVHEKTDANEMYFVGKAKSAPKAKAKKAEKEFIEIEARFERPARGGGRGRGGRGGGEERSGGRGRGGRGRGERFNNNTSRNASTGVDVADQNAFPSLS